MAIITVKYEIGDVVSLMSGGPDMTVTTVCEETNTVFATWFDEPDEDGYSGEPHTAEFPIDALSYEE
jgi:uncharacterized protein YodC (DUF2158 family)